MVDYWENLPYEIRGSKKKRFNYIMNKIMEEGEEGDNSSPSPSLKYNISISVKDDKGEGVSGATVTVHDIEKTTGSAGGCTFQNIVEGNQTISVVAEGYEDYSNTIDVSSDNTSFEIILTSEEEQHD